MRGPDGAAAATSSAHSSCGRPPRRTAMCWLSTQLRQREARAATAVALILWIAAALPAPAAAAALNPFGFLSKKQGISRCGHEHDEDEYQAANARIASVKAQGALNLAARIAFSPAAINVPVWFHVVTTADGTGNVTQATLQAQLDVLNGAKGYAGNFAFMLQGIDYTANDAWYSGIALSRSTNKSLELEIKSALRRGGNDTLNIYFMDASPFLGFSYYPTVLENSTTAILDGLVISPATLPGGSLAGYNLGYTVVHETGHWLLLSHTFQGGCTSPNDFVADTPMSASATSGCPTGRHSCGNSPTPDMVTNYMDYSDDPCYRGLTAGQVVRMQWAWATYRSPVKSPVAQSEQAIDLGPVPASTPPPPPPPARPWPPPPKASKPTPKPTPRPALRPTPKPTPKVVPKPTKRPVLQPKKPAVSASTSSKRVAPVQRKRVPSPKRKTLERAAGTQILKSKPQPRPSPKRTLIARRKARKPARLSSG